MFSFLDKIRSLPEGRRRQFVWIGALVITGMIFLLWLGTFRLQFVERASKQIAATSSPFQVIQNSFSQIIDSGARIFELDKFISEIETPRNGTTTQNVNDGESQLSDDDLR